MEDSSTETIEVSQPPPSVFSRLKDLSRWWGGPDLATGAAEAGDEFTIIHGDAHYSRQRVTEVVPDTRIVWLVTESRLNWLQNDKSEWTVTKMIFEITAENDSTRLRFTHEGLPPSKESYARCAEGLSHGYHGVAVRLYHQGDGAFPTRNSDLPAEFRTLYSWEAARG
jgi:uncharacterized protein YndB with AHSA1/START domain